MPPALSFRPEHDATRHAQWRNLRLFLSLPLLSLPVPQNPPLSFRPEHDALRHAQWRNLRSLLSLPLLLNVIPTNW
jgi:hypothetical protein